MKNIFIITVSTVRANKKRGTITSRDVDGELIIESTPKQLYANTVKVYKVLPEGFTGDVDLSPISFNRNMAQENPLVDMIEGFIFNHSETSFMDVRGTWIVDANDGTATSCTRMQDGVSVVRDKEWLTEKDHLSDEQLNILLGCL